MSEYNGLPAAHVNFGPSKFRKQCDTPTPPASRRSSTLSSKPSLRRLHKPYTPPPESGRHPVVIHESPKRSRSSRSPKKTLSGHKPAQQLSEMPHATNRDCSNKYYQPEPVQQAGWPKEETEVDDVGATAEKKASASQLMPCENEVFNGSCQRRRVAGYPCSCSENAYLKSFKPWAPDKRESLSFAAAEPKRTDTVDTLGGKSLQGRTSTFLSNESVPSSQTSYDSDGTLSNSQDIGPNEKSTRDNESAGQASQPNVLSGNICGSPPLLPGNEAKFSSLERSDTEVLSFQTEALRINSSTKFSSLMSIQKVNQDSTTAFQILSPTASPRLPLHRSTTPSDRPILLRSSSCSPDFEWSSANLTTTKKHDGVVEASSHHAISRNWDDCKEIDEETIDSEERSFIATPSSDDEEAFKAREEDPVLRQIKGTLIRLMLEEYIACRPRRSAAFNSCAGQQTSSTPQNRGNQKTQRQSTPAKQSAKKRKLDQNDSENEEDDSGHLEPPRSNIDRNAPDERLLACPYFKRDPDRYSDRNTNPDPRERKYRHCCNVVIQAESHRLKQHLFRAHKRPDYYCLRCFTEFANQGLLTTHARAVNCENQECPWPELMTPEQFSLVKRRNVKKPIEDLWYEIWDTLFEGVERPQSVFANVSGTVFDANEYWTANATDRLSERLYPGISELLDRQQLQYIVADGRQPFINKVVEIAVETLRSVAQEIGTRSSIAAQASQNSASSAATHRQNIGEQVLGPTVLTTQQVQTPTSHARLHPEPRFGLPDPITRDSSVTERFGQYATPLGPTGLPSPQPSGLMPQHGSSRGPGSDFDEALNCFGPSSSPQGVYNPDLAPSSQPPPPYNPQMWQMHPTGGQFNSVPTPAVRGNMFGQIPRNYSMPPAGDPPWPENTLGLLRTPSFDDADVPPGMAGNEYNQFDGNQGGGDLGWQR